MVTNTKVLMYNINIIAAMVMHMTWKHCKHPANDAGRASQDALQLYTPSHPQKKDTVVSFTSVCEISDKVASIIVCLSVCV